MSSLIFSIFLCFCISFWFLGLFVQTFSVNPFIYFYIKRDYRCYRLSIVLTTGTALKYILDLYWMCCEIDVFLILTASQALNYWILFWSLLDKKNLNTFSDSRNQFVNIYIYISEEKEKTFERKKERVESKQKTKL